MKLMSRLFIAVFFLILQCVPGLLPSAHALEKVSLQLKWRHAFQFAGYYAAQQQGYYRSAGLDVEMREADPFLNVINEVVSGHVNYAVGSSGLLIARSEQKPVVVLAVIFQHSPQVLIARQDRGNQSVHDLAGKRLMLEPQSEELIAYLKKEDLPLSAMQVQSHSFSVQDLLDRKIDAISAYITSEPYQLNQAGFSYQMYTPRSTGIDFYGDNLFTSESEIQQHPERVKAFIAASIKGWEYAIAHQEEMIELILSRYPNKIGSPNTRDFLRFEAAQTRALLRDDLVPVGYMNPGRWQSIADTYVQLGMLNPDFHLDGFMYRSNDSKDMKWIYLSIGAAFLFAVVCALLAWYIFQVNRKLKKSLGDVQAGEWRLKLLSMAIEHSPTSVFITDENTRIQYVNPQFTRETGYSAEEALGRTPKILQSGLTDIKVYDDMWTRLSTGKLWSGQLINRRKSGEIYWEEAHIAPVFGTDGKLCNYVAVKLDITERKHANDRLAHMAHHDSLTNLPNRVLFFERLKQGLALAKRNNSSLALMYIDLDKFKPVNDTYGHAVGDLLLQEAAQRMLQCVRDADTVGRIGGDEFVGLMLDIGDASNAENLGKKICSALNIPFVISGNTHTISASIGIAIFPDHGQDEISLAQCADIAMYHAKSSGRDNVKLFQPHMRDASRIA